MALARLGCPHRLARPRTLPFHGSDGGSNPPADAFSIAFAPEALRLSRRPPQTTTADHDASRVASLRSHVIAAYEPARALDAAQGSAIERETHGDEHAALDRGACLLGGGEAPGPYGCLRGGVERGVAAGGLECDVEGVAVAGDRDA